ncbi:hypothetical protein FB192DRAFT_1460721 [Mucor lusitanicus]|uniref:Uncharacterized protein n=1 Tax=Mucor circinelloides f. lusitanicus TaxID=29924 RepID=A0A8H4BBD4_MUCCL|nr:hypothetical protein FB192DRAFT_1460721 [Mucor lusitanicus]
MSPSIASTSKRFQPQKSFDELLSAIPLFNQPSSSCSSTPPSFRTNEIVLAVNDPELYMGDDCDASYEATLLNSGLLDWLSKEDTITFHHSSSQKRLEMLLTHLSSSSSADTEEMGGETE